MEHPALVVDVTPRFGFWRRLIAAFADAVFLLLVGLLSTPFGDQLMALGQKGKMIGLAISLAYYGVLNSGLGGGATLGKRLLGMRVIGRNGEFVPLWRSLWRALIYLLPFYFYAIDPAQFWVPKEHVAVAASTLQAINVCGVLLIVYLYLFNSRTRQSLHDLLAGTFVVRTDRVAKPIAARIRGLHVAVALVVFALAGGLVFAAKYIDHRLSWGNFGSIGAEFGQLTRLATVAAEEPGVIGANAAKNTTYLHSARKNETITTLTITVFLNRRPPDPPTVGDAVAARVLNAAPDALGNQDFCVAVKWGYDIGIGSYWESKQVCDTVDAWKSKLNPKRPLVPVIKA